MIKYGIGLVEEINAHTAEVFIKILRKQQAGYVNRKSSHSLREQYERDSLLARRMIAEGHKSELLTIPYGGEPSSDDGKLLVSTRKARYQRDTICHTSRGDFCHLHTGTHEVK